MTFVFFINGLLLVGMSGCMALNALLFPATRILFADAALLTFILGGSISLSTFGRHGGIDRLHSFLLTGSTWIVAASAGALPLWLWGMSVPDAFFEAM